MNAKTDAKTDAKADASAAAPHPDIEMRKSRKGKDSAPKPPKSDDKALGAMLTIAARIHRARMAELLAGVGLYPGQEQVLQFLADNDDPTMSALADALTVKAPTISKTIGRLTQQGLVERKAGESDARLVRVTLTAAGRERVSQLTAIGERLEDEMTRGFDGKDRKRLRRLLRKASKNLAKASGRRMDATALLDADDSDDADA
ncbi:MAG: MarR family winged helix-turn-helix transcriptional regulator [Beijerinckiaceae bacterium]